MRTVTLRLAAGFACLILASCGGESLPPSQVEAPSPAEVTSPEQAACIGFEDAMTLLRGKHHGVALGRLISGDDDWLSLCESLEDALPGACETESHEIIEGYFKLERLAGNGCSAALRELSMFTIMHVETGLEVYLQFHPETEIPSERPFPSGPTLSRFGAIWEQLARLGDADAQAFIGSIYLKEVPAGAGTERVGWLVEEQNEEKGEQYLLLAAEGGSIFAMVELAALLSSKNPVESFKWAKLAALKGSGEGARQVAIAFNLGSGTLKDRVQAAAWSKIAESKGATSTWHKLYSSMARAEKSLIESGERSAASAEFPSDFELRVDVLAAEIFEDLPLGDIDGEALPVPIKIMEELTGRGEVE